MQQPNTNPNPLSTFLAGLLSDAVRQALTGILSHPMQTTPTDTDTQFATQFDTLTDTRLDNGMIGKYVIVRCKDAGVHAGILRSHAGREAILDEARRLWYWKPANGAAFLSGVAVEGLDDAQSKIGAPITVHLLEACEIILCTDKAAASIAATRIYTP